MMQQINTVNFMCLGISKPNKGDYLIHGSET